MKVKKSIKRWKTYTVRRHAYMLKKMLSEENPCSRYACPSNVLRNVIDGYKYGCSDLKEYNVCATCKAYIGIHGYNCPCRHFGEEEALKRTYLQLEKDNYI